MAFAPLTGKFQGSRRTARASNMLVRMRLLLLATLFALAACRSPQDAQAQRENEFREMLTGAKLTGRFTMKGSDRIREDSYEISSVTKLPAGDLWTIQSRIKYGDKDVTIPVPVRIEWAGDTPVLQLTNATLPGLGTFTVRLLFYKDSQGQGHYAGFWWGGDHGGEMFGTISK